MTEPSDSWAGTGFLDFSSSDGRIFVREEAAGEIFRMATVEYWHLNREFDGRSIFFGSGINAFVDPYCRFLVLRDASVALAFDYQEGVAWHAESPWSYCPGVKNFPEIEFTDSSILVGRFRTPILRDNLKSFFSPGLGRSSDGFMTSYWRPKVGAENVYSRRLKDQSVLLRT